MTSDERWPVGQGPGNRRLSWQVRVKRWMVDIASRDSRVRRMALNRIFAEHGAKGVLCLVPFDDHSVFVDPRDDRIAYTLICGRSWQRDDLGRALRQASAAGRLVPDKVFVDVGANIGLMTLYALLSGQYSRAVAIEPDPWNRQILERNLEVNGLSDRVIVVAKAVSDHGGSMRLHRDTKNLGAHSLERGFVLSPDSAGESVAVDRLDAILAELGIAGEDIGFVKIDVEGHEFAALAGMSELLLQRPPVMIEVTFGTRPAGPSAFGGEEIDRLRELMPEYETVLDIAAHAGSAGPMSFASFRPTETQHELLVL